MPELVKAENLVQHVPVAAGRVHAVDDVSFSIMEGETLGWSASPAAASRPPDACWCG